MRSTHVRRRRARTASRGAAASTLGATAAFQYLNMPFQMLNCFLVGSQYWNIAYGREPGEAARDAEGMQTMRTLARNLAWLLKSAAAGAVPRPVGQPWQPMHFIR